MSLPTDESRIRAVYQTLKRKRSSASMAELIGLPLDEYVTLKEQIQEVLELISPDLEDTLENHVCQTLQGQRAFNSTLPLSFITHQQGSAQSTTLLETSHDVENGESRVTVVSTTEPQSAEEVEVLLKLDKSKWKLKQYWMKQKTGRWEISALVSKKSEQDTALDEYYQSLKDIFSQTPIDPVLLPPVIGSRRCLVLYLSDKHVGASVARKALYGNHYSDEVYEQRMISVLFKVQELVKRFGIFQRIIIADMGDKMDGLNGFTTRGGHKLPQDKNNRGNYNDCLRVEKRFFDSLLTSGAAEEYTVIQNCNSNHGGDFEYMVSAHLQEYLNLKYPQVETRLQEKFIEHLHYGVHTILFTHGKDDEHMKHGLPMNLNEKTENFLNKYLMFHNINVNQQVVTLAKGDLHVNNSQYAYGFRYRNCASLFGSSDWIQTNFGPGRPGCSFDIFDENSHEVLEGFLQFALN